MAQVYAAKLPSRPSTPISTIAAVPGRLHRLHAVRTAYSKAANSFLLRDFSSTAAHLVDATAQLHNPSEQAWLQALRTGQEDFEGELRRKVAILSITLFATIHDLPPPSTPYPADIARLLSLPASTLIQTLWASLLLPATPAALDILPTPNAAFVHPSLVTALTLCALKLSEPRLARQVAESWFGSTAAEVEACMVDTIEGEGLDLSRGEYGLAGLAGSTVSLGKGRKSGKKALVASWLRLLDTLTLHVLPRLGEWEAAEDFVRLQSGENGGWLPDARVEAMLAQMEDAKEREVRGIASRIAKQKALDLAAADKIRERKLSKGKGRPSPSPPTSPTSTATPLSTNSTPSVLQPPSTVAGSTNVKGFAALRSSLSQFLSTSNDDSTLTSSHTTTTSSSILKAFPSVLIRTYKADPLRFLSIVSCVVALLSWYRRNRLLPSRSAGRSKRELLGDVLGRVGETLKMGTRVSSL